jgi:ACDE family multidrug resistance protein
MKATKLYLQPNLQIIFAVTLMAVLGVANITPAFPGIMRELGIKPQAVGYLITIFTLPGIFLTPVLGVLGDRIGRKKILFLSLLLFGIAGGACSFARDFSILMLLRFVQGIGAAALGSLNVTIIGDLYSGRERAAAMGYNASVLSIGTASYPAIGGALALLGWYYPFALSFLAIPIGFWVYFSLDSPEPKKQEYLRDYLKNAWISMRNRRVFVLFILSTVLFIILYGSYLTFFPLLISQSFSESSLIIGIMMSCMSLTTAVTSSQMGRLSNRFPQSTLLKVSYLLYAPALVLMPFMPSLGLLLMPIIIFGLAHGMNVPCVQTLLADLAPQEYRAAFMSINGMVLRLGQTLGPVIMGLVFSIAGITGTFYVGALFALGAFALLMTTFD